MRYAHVHMLHAIEKLWLPRPVRGYYYYNKLINLYQSISWAWGISRAWPMET